MGTPGILTGDAREGDLLRRLVHVITGELLSEAQDLLEALASSVSALDDQQHAGRAYDPDLLNGAFRAVHSLKGLTSMFDIEAVAQLAHVLENTLDALRLGRLTLGPDTFDVLYLALDTFQRLFTQRDDPSIVVDIDPLLARLSSLSDPPEDSMMEDPMEEPVPPVDGLAELDPALLGMLTEFEEHRLRENVRMGRRLLRVHASFDLMAIDVGIDGLRGKLKTFGEVITFLPSADVSSPDRLDLDILLGTDHSSTVVASGLTDEDGVTVHDMIPSAAPEPAAPVPTRPPPSPAPSAEPQPDAPAPRRTELASLHDFSPTVKVDLSRLDHLMTLVSELGVVQSNLGESLDQLRARGDRSELVRSLRGHVRGMERQLALLQQGLLDVRMVPLRRVFDRLVQRIRQLERELGKEIRVEISGAETELDKLIVEGLTNPLEHMIRNAADHAIESPAERLAAGKPPGGKIELRAFPLGNRVAIEMEDDGRGMDWRKIRDAAVAKGLITSTEAATLGEREAIELIYRPSLSTAAEVTTTSGRGVGMDVVKTDLAQMSGRIEVTTVVGRGTKFSITLPVTLAIIQALVIESAQQTFCIPLSSVLESIMVRQSDIATVEGHEVISLRGRTLPLLHLSRMFGLASEGGYADPDRIYVVIVGLAQDRVGLVVDELVGQQDVMIKPLGSALRSVPGLAGATELGANRTVLLLDVAGLVDEALAHIDTSATSATSAPSGPEHHRELS